eukprot:524830-Amphidinium_carterae.1
MHRINVSVSRVASASLRVDESAVEINMHEWSPRWMKSSPVTANIPACPTVQLIGEMLLGCATGKHLPKYWLARTVRSAQSGQRPSG